MRCSIFTGYDCYYYHHHYQKKRTPVASKTCGTALSQCPYTLSLAIIFCLRLGFQLCTKCWYFEKCFFISVGKKKIKSWNGWSASQLYLIFQFTWQERNGPGPRSYKGPTAQARSHNVTVLWMRSPKRCHVASSAWLFTSRHSTLLSEIVKLYCTKHRST